MIPVVIKLGLWSVQHITVYSHIPVDLQTKLKQAAIAVSVDFCLLSFLPNSQSRIWRALSSEEASHSSRESSYWGKDAFEQCYCFPHPHGCSVFPVETLGQECKHVFEVWRCGRRGRGGCFDADFLIGWHWEGLQPLSLVGWGSAGECSVLYQDSPEERKQCEGFSNPT